MLSPTKSAEIADVPPTIISRLSPTMVVLDRAKELPRSRSNWRCENKPVFAENDSRSGLSKVPDLATSDLMPEEARPPMIDKSPSVEEAAR
ncbi:MAG: hypothetical protein BWX66_01673 [Deltaproteobacteria bacterium ADurb.Bin058]|nr:MAG: hypothetical protein BWX66_01673 [Deltaproteobacteria bacterium ADurb.Bin058]